MYFSDSDTTVPQLKHPECTGIHIPEPYLPLCYKVVESFLNYMESVIFRNTAEVLYVVKICSYFIFICYHRRFYIYLCIYNNEKKNVCGGWGGGEKSGIEKLPDIVIN